MNYAEYEAAAKRLYATAPKGDQPGQKFPRGSRVKVDDEMPHYMSHFDKGFIGIVEYTYAQKYHGDDVKSYSLLVLNDEGKPINTIAWYEENQLTLIDEDIKTGLELIEQYKF